MSQESKLQPVTRIDRKTPARAADIRKAAQLQKRLTVGSRHKYGSVTVRPLAGALQVVFHDSYSESVSVWPTAAPIADIQAAALEAMRADNLHKRETLEELAALEAAGYVQPDGYEDARADMRAEAAAAGRDAGLPAPRCQWFAKCENDATTSRRHVILGSVDICERCDDKASRLEAAAAPATREISAADLRAGMTIADGSRRLRVGSVSFSHNVGRHQVFKVVFIGNEPAAAPSMFSTRRPVTIAGR